MEVTEEQKQHFTGVKFVNLSMSFLGVFSQECSTFLTMLENLGLDNAKLLHPENDNKQLITMRASYYIFCCRNKEW